MKANRHALLGLVLWSCVLKCSQCQTLEAPSGSGAWLWEVHDSLNDVSFGTYYLQYSGIYDELVLCVFQCLQIRECQSFTVNNSSLGYTCAFHSRRFSYLESTWFGIQTDGMEYFMIQSSCVTSDSHFFSREAQMCISTNVIKRKKQAARDYCIGLGGDLVVIDTANKEAFIADVMAQTYFLTTMCFHTDAQAANDIYMWSDGTPVSSDLLATPYDPLNECVEIKYNTTGKLTGTVYDCENTNVAVICEYPI